MGKKTYKFNPQEGWGLPQFLFTPNLNFFVTINSVQSFKTVAHPLLGEKLVWVGGGCVNLFQCSALVQRLWTWTWTKLNNIHKNHILSIRHKAKALSYGCSKNHHFTFQNRMVAYPILLYLRMYQTKVSRVPQVLPFLPKNTKDFQNFTKGEEFWRVFTFFYF